MTMLDDRDRLLLDTLRSLAKANEEIERLREVLEKIKGGRSADPQLDAIRVLGQSPSK